MNDPAGLAACVIGLFFLGTWAAIEFISDLLNRD